jgi:hypothetical protein
MESYEILERAAAFIEQRGWAQRVLTGWDGSLCTVGALYEVVGYTPHAGQFLMAPYRALCAVLNRPVTAPHFEHAQAEIINWNDTRGREKLDVVIALRKAAANERARVVESGVTDLCATFSKAATQVTAVVSAIEAFEPLVIRKRPAAPFMSATPATGGPFTTTAFGPGAWVKPAATLPTLEMQ